MITTILHPVLTGLLSFMLLCGGMIPQCACAVGAGFGDGCGDSCASCSNEESGGTSACCCSSAARSCCAPASKTDSPAKGCCAVDLTDLSIDQLPVDQDEVNQDEPVVAPMPCGCSSAPALPSTPVIPGESVELPTSAPVTLSEPLPLTDSDSLAAFRVASEVPSQPPCPVLLCTWRE